MFSLQCLISEAQHTAVLVSIIQSLKRKRKKFLLKLKPKEQKGDVLCIKYVLVKAEFASNFKH